MSLQVQKLDEIDLGPSTSLLYCAPGVGKSTAIGIIAEQSKGNTLVIDVDRTITKTLKKGEIVNDTSKLIIHQLENRAKNERLKRDGAFEAWCNLFKDLTPDFIKACEIENIAVDNISELQRCILSDLGQQGKNRGVPDQAAYQYMQFALVNSLRQMKSLGVNIIWTAWEDYADITNSDGSKYTQIVPQINKTIRNNICGLCDVVGRIMVNKENKRAILLEATQNIYAKNQIDSRKGCKVQDFAKWEATNTKEEK